MTVIEKILASHGGKDVVKPGDIVDVVIDARVARDFGGANVVAHMVSRGLTVNDPSKTFFTFDCNPTGSDQKYAANQHRCRQYARENGIRVYDINTGIGTHLLMEEGLVWPGSTAVSTDSHANILGAVGAFGQGMGDKDIAASWHRGTIWFKVPPTVKIVFKGRPAPGISAKEIALNLLHRFGACSLLGHAIEVAGELVDELSLDQRITIASMATEMGAIIILFPPNKDVISFCGSRSGRRIVPVEADPDAGYAGIVPVDATAFVPRVSRPGKPHDTSGIPVERVWIDSAFIGSCTNGRIGDLREAAAILKGRKVAPGVVLKIVPATDSVWQECLAEGLLDIFKGAGALVSNAGCAGCAAGQVGQNGPGEVTVSTGNRNFPGKQGQGDVYLASPAVVAASAVAGFITGPEHLPEPGQLAAISRPVKPPVAGDRGVPGDSAKYIPGIDKGTRAGETRPHEVTGRAWFISMDNIDTDMIYHNRHLSVTDLSEMGQYTFGNLEGYEDFTSRVRMGDIVVAGNNFGSGSSRQQAVDCFVSLGVQCVIARSFGAIYERNAINAAFPIMTSNRIEALQLEDGDELTVNFRTGEIRNNTRGVSVASDPFSEVQMEIYQNNGLF